MASEDKSNPKDASQDDLQPVMEVIADDEDSGAGSSSQDSSTDDFVPEKISEETPEDLTLSDIGGGGGEGTIEDAPVLDDGPFGGNMRKYIFIGLGVVGVLVLFVVVFSVIFSLVRGDESDEPVTLVYWGLWEDEAVMKTIIEDYQRENENVTINYEKQNSRDYRDKLVTRSQEGRGPDIFRFHNTWLPSIIEVTAPLPSSVMSNQEYEETFYDVIQDDMFSEGSYYGISLGIDSLVLVYNKDLFERTGITTVPKTWDELVRVANQLRVQGPDNEIITAGIAIGTAHNVEHFSDIFGWMLLQNGANLRTLRSDEAVGSLANYRSFAEPQVNLWSSDMPNDINAFLQNKVAMIIVPSWQILQIVKANPEIDVGVESLPVLPGTEPLSLATYWVDGVSRASAHQEEAWKFLKYMSQKEVMTKLYEEQAKVRLFGVPYSRVDLRDTLIDNKYVGPVLEQAPHLQSLPTINRTYDNALNDEIVGYIRDAINSTQEGVSYQQAMNTAASGIEQTLETYNIE